MVRIKGGVTTRRKHKKILKAAKGYRMTRHKQIRKAKEALLHAGSYSYHGRKLKKRYFRRLWITRLNASISQFGIKYSHFIKLLRDSHIELDRKILAKIATEYPKVFNEIVLNVTNKKLHKVK